MVVKVSAVHEVEDKAKLVRGVEGVGHTDDEGAIVARWHQTQHDPLVQGKGLTLLHFDAFFVQTLNIHIILTHSFEYDDIEWREVKKVYERIVLNFRIKKNFYIRMPV